MIQLGFWHVIEFKMKLLAIDWIEILFVIMQFVFVIIIFVVQANGF